MCLPCSYWHGENLKNDILEMLFYNYCSDQFQLIFNGQYPILIEIFLRLLDNTVCSFLSWKTHMIIFFIKFYFTSSGFLYTNKTHKYENIKMLPKVFFKAFFNEIFLLYIHWICTEKYDFMNNIIHIGNYLLPIGIYFTYRKSTFQKAHIYLTYSKIIPIINNNIISTFLKLNLI